jgi:hypothetical protein
MRPLLEPVTRFGEKASNARQDEERESGYTPRLQHFLSNTILDEDMLAGDGEK